MTFEFYSGSPAMMPAMVLEEPGQPLVPYELPIPQPGPGQVLIQVKACGVCRTDLHILDGELAHPKLPLVLGHEIAGVVAEVGEGVTSFRPGEKVGVPWLGHTCGTCSYCRSGRENLCDTPGFTGYTLDGGYAGYTVADHDFVFHLPEGYSDQQAAPLLCAGLIGYRSYRMVGKTAQSEGALGEGVHRLGLYGFGAAAHILTQIAVQQGKEVYAFTAPGDTEKQDFARQLGAAWAGGSDSPPPVPMDAAILFAPVGGLVPVALKSVAKGGVVVCAGIHMSPIPSFAYNLLWEERVIRSVANLTRQDGEEFFQVISRFPVKVATRAYPLSQANQALFDLRKGRFEGAAVVIP